MAPATARAELPSMGHPNIRFADPPLAGTGPACHLLAPRPRSAGSEDNQAKNEPDIAATDSPPQAPTTPPVAKPSRHRLQWPGRELHAIDYLLTGGVFAAAIIVENTTRPVREARWTGGILFDDAAQKLILGKSREARTQAQDLSAYFTILPQIAAVVDGSAVPLLLDKFNWRVAWKMSLINVQAISLTGLLSRSGHRTVGRERPDVALCEKDELFSERCGSGNNSSFPSGHSSTAFVGAGLVCAHHLSLPLYGHPALDVSACALSLGLASTSGVLRIKTGRHYASDVLAGALIGFGAGFVIPRYAYYRKRKSEPDDAISWMVLPALTADSIGVGAVGIF